MPFTVITLSKVPASLRGDLSKWMQEIDTGVYIGNFNSRIREQLWERVTRSIGQGQATISYQAQNELGYNFDTFNTERLKVDFDGLFLVMFPSQSKPTEALKSGFSKAAQFHRTRHFSRRQTAEADSQLLTSKPLENKLLENKPLANKMPEASVQTATDTAEPLAQEAHFPLNCPPYVVLDIETDGLDPLQNRIIEIGAIKFQPKKTEFFHKLILRKGKLPPAIVELTQITDELLQEQGEPIQPAMLDLLAFIGDLPLVGYGLNFDVNFLNKQLSRQELAVLSNPRIDILMLVKREKLFLADYKLDTVLKAYDIVASQRHRALEDAKMTSRLACKVNKFYDYLKSKAGK